MAIHTFLHNKKTGKQDVGSQQKGTHVHLLLRLATDDDFNYYFEESFPIVSLKGKQ